MSNKRPFPRPVRSRALLLLATWLACGTAAGSASGGESPDARRIRPDRFEEDACRVIREEASRYGLPAAFLARLVWKESLFDPSAVSPKGAQGIAQFMPGTASERKLSDPFDAATALAASAALLSDLHAKFGSLGLAAAAYNAGPARVERWLAGETGLPAETQDYVHWITGHSAEAWVEKKGALQPLPINDKLSFMAGCRKLAARAIVAKSPAGLPRKSAAGEDGAPPGFKRVKASKPGRIRVVFEIGAPAKKAPGTKKTRRGKS